MITGTNGRGEIRVQFHVVTDGQDQFKGAIKQLLTTLAAYGQPPPELFFTDQPSVDNQFFKAQIPSLQAKQNQFDQLTTATAVQAKLPSDEKPVAGIVEKSSPDAGDL